MLIEQSLLRDSEYFKQIRQEREKRELLEELERERQEQTWQTKFIEAALRDAHLGARIVYQGPYEPLLYVESLDELMSDGTTFDAVIDALAYRGLKTLLVGLSKAGKSFTLWAKVAEVVHRGRRVMYLSEEPRGTVLDKIGTFGLREDYGKTFYVVRRGHDQIRQKPWPEVVDALASDVKELKIDLVVVDTARPWIKFEGEGSNSDSDVGRAIDALSPVCEAGAAVVVLHQSPWEGKRARGSTEFHATVDLIFHIDGQGDGPRTLKYVGGRVEGIPERQTFRMGAHGMEDLGVVRHDKAEHLDAVLKIIESSDDLLTAKEIAEQTDYNLRSVQGWLDDLHKRNRVQRVKGGVIPGGGQDPDRWGRVGDWMKAYLEVSGDE